MSGAARAAGLGLLAGLTPWTRWAWGAGANHGPEFRFVLPFLHEGDDLLRELAGAAPDEHPERRFGAGLGGRKIFDLETLRPPTRTARTDRFFIRTFHPEELGVVASWELALTGLVGKPVTLPIAALWTSERPQGIHLLECSGNSAEHRFGLLSAAEWSGTSVADVLSRVEPIAAAGAIEIAGFDLHRTPSITSRPGASWIFTREQLVESGAFLATSMNGTRLTRDHGSPVRLVVPNWYGCACIKWVTELRWVQADAASTGQMREFAARTEQVGTPEKALDFQPAVLDPVAMPVRVEQWKSAGGTTELRITGIVWGGNRPIRRLSLRCGDRAWEPVTDLDASGPRGSWRYWSHISQSVPPGRTEIRLRVDDPGIRTRRLDRGYYMRSVEVRDD